MEKWGFEYKDMITWGKTDEEGNIKGQVGRWFEHATEVCLVGIKG